MMPVQQRNHILPAHSAYRAHKAQPQRAAIAAHLQPHRLSWALATAFNAAVTVAFATSALMYTSTSQAQTAPVLPQGGAAVHGGATFQQNGNTLNVNTSNGAGNKSIINWQSFNVGAGHTTNINQPSASSSSLNRVVTNTPSQIHGQLRSNGQVILVNQSGIAVGAGGVVDTAAFTASTLNISDADYKAGKLRFEGNALSKGVQVDGTVRSSNGDVLLFAPQSNVSKDALVKADNGTVILGAGQSVEVTGRGLEGVRFIIQSPEDKATNLGTLQGNAVGIFAGSLRHSGVIKVQTASLEGGRVVLRGVQDTQVVKDPVTGAVPQIIADGGVLNGVAQAGGQIRVESTQGNVSIGPEALLSANAGGISSLQNSAQNKQLAPVNAGGGAIDLVANQGKVQVDPGAVLSVQGSPGGTIRIVSAQESRVAGVLNVSSPALLDPNSAGSLQLITPEQAGGTIQVLSAGNVLLEPSAQLLASGDAAGGTILVGGDYQGANSEIVNAKNTNVSSGVLLEVNARVNGDGGKAIVWADNATYFAGNLQAKGGEQGGNGGFGETSGKKDLYFRGRADVSARRGRTGTLLLDPRDIIIEGGSGGANDGEVSPPPASDSTVFYADGGPGSTFTISEGALELLTGNVVLQATRSIKVGTTPFTGGLSMQAGTNLTLETRNNASDTPLAPVGSFAIDMYNGTNRVDITANTVTLSAGSFGVTDPAVPIRVGSITATGSGSNLMLLRATGDIELGAGDAAPVILQANGAGTATAIDFSSINKTNTVKVNNALTINGKAVTNGGGTPTNWSFETGAVGKIHNFSSSPSPGTDLIVGGKMSFNQPGIVEIEGGISAFELGISPGATMQLGLTGKYTFGSGLATTTIGGAITMQPGSQIDSKNSNLIIAPTGQLNSTGGAFIDMGSKNLEIQGSLTASGFGPFMTISGTGGSLTNSGSGQILLTAINSPTPQNSRIVLAGSYNANFPSKSIQLVESPTAFTALGDTFTLIGNLGTGTVSAPIDAVFSSTAFFTTAGGSSLVSTVDGAKFSWVGGGVNTDWSTGANWSRGVVPTLSAAYFDTVTNPTVTISGVPSVAGLNISKDTTFVADLAPATANLNVGTSGILVSSNAKWVTGGVIANSGGLTADAGTSVTVNGSLTNTNPAQFLGNVTISAGSMLVFPNGAGNSAANLTTVASSSVVSVQNNLSIGALTVAGGGEFNGGGTITTTGASNINSQLQMIGVNWTNSGTMTVNGEVALSGGTILTNASAGIINLSGTNLESITTPSDTAPDQIINQGTMNNKAGSALGHSVGFRFTNPGTVNVETGSVALSIVGPGTDTGTYNVAAGTKLVFEGPGARVLDAPPSPAPSSFLNGLGTLSVANNSNTTLLGNPGHLALLQNGNLEIDNATLTIGPGTSLNFSNPVVLKEDAVLNINGNMTGALNVSGTGSATISNAAAPAPAVSWTQPVSTTSDITSPLTLSNINYINSGTFNNSSDVLLTNTGDSFTNNRVLSLQGTGGFSGAGVLNNSASGTICVCASSPVSPSTSIVNVLGTQAGTIDLQAGRTLDVENQFTNTGIIRGVGTLTVAGTGLTNAATGRIVPGVAATPSPGVLTINGGFTNQGTIEVRAISVGNSDGINVIGSIPIVNGSLVLNPVAPLAFAPGQFYLPVTAGGTGGVGGGFTSITSKSGPAIVANDSNVFTPTVARRVSITSVGSPPPAPAPSNINNWLDVDGDWSNAANWSLGVVPTAGQTVVINPSGTRVVTVSGGTSMQGLNFLGTDDTIFLTTGGLLNPPSGSSLSGLLRVDGGALGFNSASNANNIALSAGNLNVGSDLLVNTFNWTGGNLNLSGGSFSAGANGASGNVTVPTAGVMNLSGGNLANPVANSGLINVRSNSALAFASTSQSGRISISPGLALMLSGNPTFTTADAVTGGRLVVDTGSNLTLTANNNRGAGSITQLKGNLNAQADFSTGGLALEGGTISGNASAANRLSVTDSYSESGGGKIGTGFGALSIRQSKGDLSLANAVTLSGASPGVSLQSDEGNISASFAHTAGTQFAALSVGSGKQATITLQGDALQSAPLASNGSVVLNMNGSDVQWMSDGNSLSNLRVNEAGRVSLDNDRSLTLSGDSSKGVVLNAFGTATLGDASTNLSVGAGGLSVIANADIVQGAAITITGDSSLSANGDIRLPNADNRIAGVLGLNAASTDLKATGPITLTTSNAAGGVRVDTAGSLAVQGNVTGGGTVLLKGAGDVVLGGGTSAVEVRGAAGTSIEGGNIRLAGGTSEGASTRLGAGSSAPVSITTAGNFVIEGGSGAGSFAAVEATGNVNTLVGGTLSIIGGTGVNAYAKLDPSLGALLDVKAPVVNVQGGSAPGAFAAVVSDGNINFDSRNLTLTPGTGTDADAVVVSSAGVVKLPEQCNGCVVLTKNPLGNGVIETGVFSGATAPAPSPTPPAPPAPAPAPPAPAPAPGAPPPAPPAPAPASAAQTVRDLVSIQLAQIDRVVLVATNSPDNLLNLASPEDQRRRLGQSRITVEGDICRP
jgi:filamentous hemagglutinin family protein